MRKILMCLFVVMLLAGCSKTEEAEVVEDSETETLETEDEESIVQEEVNLACITATKLRVRKSPNGEVNKVTGWDGKERNEIAEDRCYLILDETEDEEHTWIKIDEDKWIAADPEWTVRRVLDSNDNIYKTDERAVYSDNKYETGSDSASNNRKTPKDIDSRILSLLWKTIPSLNDGGLTVKPELDVNNLSDSDKASIFRMYCLNYSLYRSNLSNLIEESEKMFTDNAVAINGDSMWVYNYSLILKEHIDEFCNRYYGRTIDFTTVENYDAVNQVYKGSAYPTGMGADYTHIYILDKKTEGSIMTVTLSPVTYYSESGNFEVDGKIYDYKFNQISDDKLDDYINNNPLMFQVEIDVRYNDSWKFIRTK